MIKSMSRKKILLAAVATGFLLVAFVVGRNSLLPRPDMIGDFIMPTLPGWEQGVTRTKSLSSMIYVKQAQGTEGYVSLVWYKAQSSKSPLRTVQDLQKEEQRTRQETASLMARLKARNRMRFFTQTQMLLNQPTSLNGMPALLTQNITKGRRVTHLKLLRFINGGNFYILAERVSAPSDSPISPQVQAESDQAWKTITAALNPA